MRVLLWAVGWGTTCLILYLIPSQWSGIILVLSLSVWAMAEVANMIARLRLRYWRGRLRRAQEEGIALQHQIIEEESRGL